MYKTDNCVGTLCMSHELCGIAGLTVAGWKRDAQHC